ncbi:MAG: hypothetical protein VX695_07665, partial [Chloroflexota bacterium]|nr:hypothetical protein [Chloroflexota bacterium]
RNLQSPYIMIDCWGTIRDKLDKVNPYWMPESIFKYLSEIPMICTCNFFMPKQPNVATIQ